MWSQEYKPGYYIQGTNDSDECVALHSPTGTGYVWRRECKNLQSAKIMISQHIKATCVASEKSTREAE